MKTNFPSIHLNGVKFEWFDQNKRQFLTFIKSIERRKIEKKSELLINQSENEKQIHLSNYIHKSSSIPSTHNQFCSLSAFQYSNRNYFDDAPIYAVIFPFVLLKGFQLLFIFCGIEILFENNEQTNPKVSIRPKLLTN